MIISMNTYRASLADFIQERKQALKDMAGETPWFLLMATPIYVDSEKIDPLRDDIRDVLQNMPGNPDLRYKGIFTGRPTPRISGVEAAYPETRIPQPYEKFLRLFRNGHLEYCENCNSEINGYPPDQVMQIYTYKVTITALQFLNVAKQIMRLGEVSEPITITAHWHNFNPSRLLINEGSHLKPSAIFTWEEEITIELTASELSDPPSLTNLLIDRLFNAFRYERNPHFDDDNNLLKWR